MSAMYSNNDLEKAVPKVLVVCMGNICRSPTAHAVLRAKASLRHIPIDIDSAGTIDFHQGSMPDPRSREVGELRGYDFSGIRARQITQQDFSDFDLILTADKTNLSNLMSICPEEHQHKLALFMSFSDTDYQEIPDPYYGGKQGFELVVDIVELGADDVLSYLEANVR